MKKKNIILLGALLTCAIDGMAQTGNAAKDTGDKLQNDSIWKDVDLGAVSVVASKPLIKMETDKMTYNVADDAEAKASTVLDMLRKVPRVTVDGQDNISVNGSSSFKVYVDGKLNPMYTSNASQIFKVMPATMVKSIEVVTNPGAKYDAEGTGGVLNIVLNKRRGVSGGDVANGYNGNVSVAGGNQIRRVSALVNGQQGKLTYSANGMLNHQRMNGTTIDFDRVQKVKAGAAEVTGADADSHMAYHQKSDMKQPYAMGNISLSYDLDSLSTISAMADYVTFKQKINGQPTTRMYGGIYGKGFSYSNEMRQETGTKAFYGSVDYQRFWNDDRKSYMILSYLFNNSLAHTNNYTFYDKAIGVTGVQLNDLRSNNATRATEHTLQADFTQALGTKHTLNFGAKFINRLNKADSKYYDVAGDRTETFNPGNSVEYENTQGILAAYAEWKAQWGKLGSVMGGRYEYTWEDVKYRLGSGDDFKKHYGVLVPSASLSYGLAAGMNIGMNYSMRIERPGISYLNPYVDRSNPTALSYGNSNLDTEKSHTVNMVYNYYSAKFMLSATAGYTFCDNQIEQCSFIDDNNLLNQTYGNVAKKRNASLNLFVNWMLAKKTRLIMNAQVSYVDVRSRAVGLKNNGWSGNAMLNLQQTLPWDMLWTLGGILTAKTYNLQGYQGGMTMAYTTLWKQLLKDKLDLSLTFLTPMSDKLDIKTRTRSSDYVQDMTVRVPIRQATLTLNWKFGNTKKQFKKVKTNITNDFKEDKGGIQTGGLTEPH